MLEEQARAGFNYDTIGLTRDSDVAPSGFATNRCRTIVGHGEAAFDRAKLGIRQLRMLNLGWINVVPSGTRLAPDANIATLAKFFAGYALQVARVVYVLEDQRDSERRFGFGYGTLPEYVMRGEERFLVSIDEATGDVAFEIYSFSQPSTLFGKLGRPYLKRTQWRFARDSADEMKRFVSG